MFPNFVTSISTFLSFLLLFFFKHNGCEIYYWTLFSSVWKSIVEVFRNAGLITCPGEYNWGYCDLIATRNELFLRDHVFKFIYIWIGEAPLHWAVDILETWERELDSTLNLNHMSFLQLGADGHGDLDNVKPRPCALGLPKSIMYLWLDPKFGTALWSETWITAKKLFSRSHRTTRQQPAHTTKEAAVCNQSTPVPCGEGNVISLTSYKHSFIFILRYFIHFEFTFVLGDYIRVWFHSSKYRYTVFFVPFLRTPFFLKCLFLSCLSKVMYTTLQGYVSGSFIL